MPESPPSHQQLPVEAPCEIPEVLTPASEVTSALTARLSLLEHAICVSLTGILTAGPSVFLTKDPLKILEVRVDEGALVISLILFIGSAVKLVMNYRKPERSS